ncbi:MAG: protein kinase, partial [Candidatus Competibacteraceae bacterium]|nr:protein kinase [Candidatus Competibacteraceae bacterium]
MDIEVPGYDIKHEIGRGGMATVYLARQISFGRDVALKILSPLLVGDEGFTRRFLKEASTVANLMHPNIIKVFDTGAHNDLYYLAMEYFPAGTLKQRIDDGLEPATSIRIIRAVLEALRYAHGQGLIHRDIKSQNILLYEDDTPVVTDFGIVKIVGEKTMLTVTGLSVGSPLYMSPEQIKGSHTVDERSDLYSVGILFYEMLTGRVPFDAEETFAVAFKHLHDPLPILPADLAAFQPFIAGLLAKEPANRFTNATAALKMLDQCLVSKAPAPAPDSTVVFSSDKAVTRASARINPAQARSKPARSSRKLTGTILTLTLLTGAGTGFYVWQQQQRQAELEQQRQAELEQQRQAELAQQRQTELAQQRQTELEQQRQTELEQQRQTELEQQRQTELEQQRQAELEQQRQT